LRSRIFRDRGKLSPYYVPSFLPHREDQIKLLESVYGRMLDDIGNVYPRYIQIFGATGTGKTCTTLRFGETLRREAERRGISLVHAYMNCKVDGTKRYVLYGNLLRKTAPQIQTRSLSPEEMLRQLVEYLKDRGMYVLITFDEIDYFVKTNPREHVIYDVTRIPEMHPGEPSPLLGSIFISRTLKWHERLEPCEKSTLGLGVIEFSKYNQDQIRDILESRVGEAFQPGVVGEEVISLISDIVSSPPVNGDVRVGLDLLYFSGNLAENMGASRVLPDHVRKVYSETNPTITTEDILSLDEDEIMVLLALVRSLQVSKSAYVGLREFREDYLLLCEEYNVKPVETFEEHVQDLIYRGIVDMKSLTELGISGASLVDLEKFLNSLIERLRRRIDEPRT